MVFGPTQRLSLWHHSAFSPLKLALFLNKGQVQLRETSSVGAWVYPRYRQSLNLQLYSETQPVPVPLSRPKVKPIWVLGGVAQSFTVSDFT